MSGTFVVHNELDPSATATFEIGTSPDVVAAARRDLIVATSKHVSLVALNPVPVLDGESSPGGSRPPGGTG